MLRVHQEESAKGHCPRDNLAKACKQYFSMRCRQMTCFDELRDPLASLDATLQQHVVEFASEEADIISESSTSSTIPLLNAVRLEYCFLFSPAMSATFAQDFVCKVVCRYGKLCGTNGKSDESVSQLAMLACMATLRATHAKQERQSGHSLQPVSLLRSAFLLRYCLTRSKDDYPTLVVLTRLLILLGAVSLSALIFKKLNIKNLQWENAGHLLLTRLSTLHPQRTNADDGIFDPLQTLDVALVANNNSVKSVTRHIMAGLNHKSYVNAMETIRLREDLKSSFSKQLYIVERTRVRRLRDLSESGKEPLSFGE